MTREQVGLICKNVRELGRLGWEADKLQMNDAEQRNIIDEQVEENRGLRADVKLMQQVNDEQREESRLLEEKLKGLCCAHGNTLMQIHDKDKEIRLLSEQVHAANKELLTRADALESSLYCYRLLAHAYELNAREIARLRTALMELHAVVKGECPSLLNEDSGGDAKLAMEIEALTQEPT